MRLLRFVLDGHRSVEYLEFDAGPLTVLFGKNNAGKTNVLETIAGVLASGTVGVIRRTHAERPSNPRGAAVVQLESGIPFDDAVASAISEYAPAYWDGTVWFTGDGAVCGDAVGGDIDEDDDPEFGLLPESWYGDAVAVPGLHVLFLDWQIGDLHERVEASITTLTSTEARRRRRDWPWLEMVEVPGLPGLHAYRVPTDVDARLRQLSSLASDLLPDFVDGAIRAGVTAATLWGDMPKVLLEYEQRGQTQCADLIDAAGHGAARWMTAAIQIALHLMKEKTDVALLRALAPGSFSGHVLLIDEPEAHLHPSAVASVVRWCHRMVRYGFTIIVASHHEEFLRAAGDGVTLVHITRDADLVGTSARALSTTATTRLRELANDVGMHPAAALSLHRAVLFVEGPLDEALIYELADGRDLPEQARGEDGRMSWRMRARHRLREPESSVDRASDEEIVALLAGCCSARDRLIVLLMARAGLRRGELCGLRRSDVHLLADSRPLGCDISSSRRGQAGIWAGTAVSGTACTLATAAAAFASQVTPCGTSPSSRPGSAPITMAGSPKRVPSGSAKSGGGLGTGKCSTAWSARHSAAAPSRSAGNRLRTTGTVPPLVLTTMRSAVRELRPPGSPVTSPIDSAPSTADKITSRPPGSSAGRRSPRFTGSVSDVMPSARGPAPRGRTGIGHS